MKLPRFLRWLRRIKPAEAEQVGGLAFRRRSPDDAPGWIPPAERREAWLRANVAGWCDRDLPIRRRGREITVDLQDY